MVVLAPPHPVLSHPSAPGAPALLAALAGRGGRPALLDPSGDVISYEGLAERAAAIGHRLGPGRRLVLLEGGNEVACVATYLGALAAGHVVALVPPGGGTVTDRVLAAFDPDVVATADGGLHHRRDGSAHRLHPDLALLLSTSGSTGSAKLVRLSAEGLRSNAAAIATYLELRDDDRAMTTLPLGYCYGLSVLNSHLAVGASIVLDDRSVVDPCFLDRARRDGVTTLAGVPHTCALLERAGFTGAELPSLRVLTQAGGRLDPEAVVRWARRGRANGFRFFVMYGQTEATARMAYLPAELAEQRPTAVGVAIPGGSLRIEPVEGAAAGEGELVYRGPNVMLGYAAGPADLARGRDVEELRTGDLARRGPDGLVEICGRRSRFLKVFGLRIDLDELEQRLAEHGHEVACAGDDRRVVIAVVDDDAGADDVLRRAAALTGLPSGAVVAVAVPEVPRLANGKPDLASIAALAAPPTPGPGSARSVAELFAAVLGVDEVGESDTFVSLGGDSLTYVEASIGLERLLGRAPHGWHLLPVATLQAQSPVAVRPGVETSVVLRAVAILAVVAAHAGLVATTGGGHLLLAVAGANAARFSPAGEARPWQRGVRQIARIALPAVALLAVGVVLVDGIHPSTVALTSSYVGEGAWRYRYWFVEALAVLLLGALLVRTVPWVRAAERRWALAVPLVGLAVALAVRDAPLGAEGWDELKAHAVAWLFVLGWAAERCRTPASRALVTAVAVGAVPGTFGDLRRELVLLGGLCLLVWVPRVPLPRRLLGAVQVLAAASLAVYLLHWLALDALLGHVPAPLAAGIGVGAGVAAWSLAGHLRGLVPGGRAVRRTGSASLGATDPGAPGRYDRSVPAGATAGTGARSSVVRAGDS